MVNCSSLWSASCGQMILKWSELQYCTQGKKTLTASWANNSQQGICVVKVSKVFTSGLWIPWNYWLWSLGFWSLVSLSRLLMRSFSRVGRFILRLEFQVNFDGKCRMWHLFLSPDKQNKPLHLEMTFWNRMNNSGRISNCAQRIEMGRNWASWSPCRRIKW